MSVEVPMGVSRVSVVHPTAEVSPAATVGESVSIWQYAHIREGARLGSGTVVGRGVYVGPDVVIGERCKIQNYALVYEPAVVANGVFIGPEVVFTNDRVPRAINPDGTLKSYDDWQPVGVTVLEGASVGARSVCVAPVTIGRWALVAAGSVVVHDVPDFALVVGSPARRIAWVGPAGNQLMPSVHGSDVLACPTTGALFRLVAPETLVEETSQ